MASEDHELLDGVELTQSEREVLKKMPSFKAILEDNVDVLSPVELDRLADQAEDSFSGDRNIEMMDFMVRTGARVGSTVWIKESHLHPETREVELKVTKGTEDQTLRLDSSHVESLLEYLNHENFPESEYNWLFPGLDGTKVTTRYVRKFMNIYARKAGLSPERVHPHLLRHTFASRFLAVTNNIKDLQHALGHDSMLTTFIYLHDLSDKSTNLITEGETFDLAMISDKLPKIGESRNIA